MWRFNPIKAAVFVVGLCSVVKGDAEPDAEPDADPDALPQLYGSALQSMMPVSTLPAQVGGGMAEVMPLPSGGLNCGMMDECCGMSDSGCCINQGQRCYTIWERKCTFANMPSCQTQTKEFCDTKALKECRFTKKPEYVNIPAKKCTPTMERKCFDYTAKECKQTQETYSHNFSWTNEEIVVNKQETVEKCHNMRTCKVINDEEERTRKVPKQECTNIPKTTKDCQSVPVPQEPIKVPTMDYRTEYRQQCYAIPKPVCRMEPCSYAVRRQNICPTGDGCNVGIGSNCVGGLCGGGIGVGSIGVENNLCGACREQNVQMCTKMTQKCEMTTEQVCQQVPIRVPVPGFRMVQPPPKYEMRCEPRTIMVPQCKTVYVPQTYKVPVRRCQDGTENKCYTYQVPVQEVVRKPENESVDFPSVNCTVQDVPKQTCHNLPTKLECRIQNVRRGVYIRQRVCDRQRMARYCKTIPFSYCQNNPGQQCQMVPRTVCQPTCEKSSYCNQCTQFANYGGFSQCSTQTCPNFISPTANCPPGSPCY